MHLPVEKEMATHSSIHAWMEEPGGLLSMGSHRVGHDWGNLACMHALEREMATHSSILAWRIPGMEEPGGLPSKWSHRVGHDWSDLAAAAPSRGPVSLSGVHMAASRTVWFSFHLGCHRSAVSLSALMFLLWLRHLPWSGDWTLVSVPLSAEGRSNPTNTLVFPPVPSSYRVLPWFYIFFPAGQVLLSSLTWYSAWTSVSEGVFLMYSWREVNSTSTYFSAILFSPFNLLTLKIQRGFLDLWNIMSS